MQLDLKPIFAGTAQPYSFVYALDLSGYELEPGEFPLKTPVTVRGSVENRAGIVTLRASAAFAYDTHCDRCGKPMVEQYDLQFRNVLVKGSQEEDMGEELLPVASDFFSVDDYITENLVLALPLKHLCRSDCRGICPRCGKDLNEGPCGCDVQ